MDDDTKKLMTFILEDGVEGQSTSATTHLMDAAKSGAKNCVKLLLEHKANPSGLPRNGFTPLHLAARNGQSECVALLIHAKADLDRFDVYDNMTPLAVSILREEYLCFNILLNAGAKMSLVNIWDMPSWVYSIIANPNRIQKSVLVFMAILRKRRGIYKDISTLLGKMIWDTRFDYVWEHLFI